ncbi:sensor histidine kinase [Peribacillus huizhouensis]|uniref:histidine kinase n=1 Tax=Peribacillus huizhouensis TaxID=1501239 RepID=A0ABR6CQ34_9BACI|nr:sensor histidine kinase [Peribacillus huizhouensis]MBA9027143.1 signal transduction histidine kinase [Peribacillus huizhouensis]
MFKRLFKIKKSYYFKILAFTTMISFIPFVMIATYSMYQGSNLSNQIMKDQIANTKKEVLSQKLLYLQKETQNLNTDLHNLENTLRLIQKQAETIYSRPNLTLSNELHVKKGKEGYLWETFDIKHEKTNIFISSISSNVANKTINDLKIAKQLEPLFVQTMKNETMINAVYLSLPSSAWLYYPFLDVEEAISSKKFAPNLRFQDYEFYTVALNPQRKVEWTKPYIWSAKPMGDVTKEDWLISAGAPVYLTTGEFKGMVGLDVPIENITNKLMDVKFSEPNAFAFLIDDKGNFISGQTKAEKIQENSSIMNSAIKNKEGILPITYSNSEAYLLSSSLNNGWRLNFIISESDIVGPIVKSTKAQTNKHMLLFLSHLLVFLLFGIIVLLYMTYRFSRTITQPIDQLTDALRESAAGNFVKELQIEQEDEIGNLAVAFNFMNQKIQELIGELNLKAHQLEDKVLERTKELESANERLVNTNQQLQESEKRRKEFMSQISHDLKTPLTSVREYTEILVNHQSLPETQKKEIMNSILLRSNHIIQLINDLFEMNTDDDGDYVKEVIPFDFLIEQSLNIIAIRSEGSEIEITKNYKKDSLFIFVDPKKMNRVFINILENAIKYSKSNNGEKIKIDIFAYQQNKNLIIKFQDYGIGISQKNKEKIFLPFFREKRTRTEKIQGNGLGLSIVQKIIAAHDGHILVESKVSVGTTITIMLPSVETLDI